MTKEKRLKAFIDDLVANPQDDHLDVLSRHVSASSIEKAREIDRRVMVSLAEDGFPPPPDEDVDIS